MNAAHPAYDAVVVGAGPNGLTAAARLARAGQRVLVLERAERVGGGCASDTFGGLVRDTCAAVHPFGAASPAFAALDLDITWAHPPIALAHPLDGGRAATLDADLGTRARTALAPLARRAGATFDALTGPVLRVPKSLVVHALLGAATPLPATVAAHALAGGDAGRALWIGIAAHAAIDLRAPFSNATAFALVAVSQIAGWPVAEGGSQRIADALADLVTRNGGEIVTGERVRSLRDLPPATATLLDVTPRQLIALAGDRLPGRARRAASRWRYGPGHCKVDYALSGPMPWTAEAARRAGTVHVGGSAHEIVAAERDVLRGRLPERPFVLVAQPDVADPARRNADEHRPLWTYTHVPSGSPVDASDAIERQFDRFAPGWRDLVVARDVRNAAQAEAHNPNLIGGDFGGGSVAGRQLIARPRLSRDPYRTAIPGVWLCSASTPPGPGVHGMCGWHAAGSVLRAGRLN